MSRVVVRVRSTEERNKYSDWCEMKGWKRCNGNPLKSDNQWQRYGENTGLSYGSSITYCDVDYWVDKYGSKIISVEEAISRNGNITENIESKENVPDAKSIDALIESMKTPQIVLDTNS